MTGGVVSAQFRDLGPELFRRQLLKRCIFLPCDDLKQLLLLGRLVRRRLPCILLRLLGVQDVEHDLEGQLGLGVGLLGFLEEVFLL